MRGLTGAVGADGARPGGRRLRRVCAVRARPVRRRGVDDGQRGTGWWCRPVHRAGRGTVRVGAVYLSCSALPQPVITADAPGVTSACRNGLVAAELNVAV